MSSIDGDITVYCSVVGVEIICEVKRSLDALVFIPRCYLVLSVTLACPHMLTHTLTHT